jgi:hypothetical protein
MSTIANSLYLLSLPSFIVFLFVFNFFLTTKGRTINIEVVGKQMSTLVNEVADASIGCIFIFYFKIENRFVMNFQLDHLKRVLK